MEFQQLEADLQPLAHPKKNQIFLCLHDVTDMILGASDHWPGTWTGAHGTVTLA